MDPRRRNIQVFRKHPDERPVCLAAGWRGRRPNAQVAVAHVEDLVTTGAWLYAHG